VVDQVKRGGRQEAAAAQHGAGFAANRERRHVQHDQARALLEVDRARGREGKCVGTAHHAEQEGVAIGLGHVLRGAEILGGEQRGEAALGARRARQQDPRKAEQVARRNAPALGERMSGAAAHAQFIRRQRTDFQSAAILGLR
jgi:hypothetical protein